jgi:hypothetical protein
MSLKVKILGIVALVIGALFTFLGLQTKSKIGQITRVSVERGNKGKKRYYMYVTWASEGTTHNDQRFPVTQTFFQSKVENDTTVKSPEVTVRYLKGPEAESHLVGGWSNFRGMEYLGYIVILVGIVVTWKAFKPRAVPAAPTAA